MRRGVTARASDIWCIDQAVTEYKALQTGSLDVFADSTAAPGGEIEYCGREDDAAHWTASYVRAEDGALLPLAVGPLERVLLNVTRIDRADTPIWDPRVLPPPVVVIDGARRHFRPARGRFLVGAVTTERRSILLVAVGEALAVVHVGGESRAVLFRGSPFSFREIDVDGLLGSRRGTDQPAPRPKAVRPSALVRNHHARIVGRLPVEVGDGPAIPEVLWCGFQDLARRAAVAPRVHAKQKRKGKTKLEVVVRALYEAGLVGCGNFEGLSGEIFVQLKAVCPGLEVSAEVFADVLRLLLAAKSCIIEHPTPRIWRICLVGLNDPRSPLHRQFCKETVGLYKHEPGTARAASTSSSSTPSSSRPDADERAAPMQPPGAPSPHDHSEQREAPSSSTSEPTLPNGPAAALAVLLLAVRATTEARAHALERAVAQVEHEEKMAELAVAAAAGARLTPPPDPPASVAAASSAVEAPEVRAPRDTSETPVVTRRRSRQLQPLFATASCITSPAIGRTRPTLAGLTAMPAPPTEAEPGCRRSVRTDVPEAVDALERTHRARIVGLLGARGPPAPSVEPGPR